MVQYTIQPSLTILKAVVKLIVTRTQVSLPPSSLGSVSPSLLGFLSYPGQHADHCRGEQQRCGQIEGVLLSPGVVNQPARNRGTYERIK